MKNKENPSKLDANIRLFGSIGAVIGLHALLVNANIESAKTITTVIGALTAYWYAKYQ